MEISEEQMSSNSMVDKSQGETLLMVYAYS